MVLSVIIEIIFSTCNFLYVSSTCKFLFFILIILVVLINEKKLRIS